MIDKRVVLITGKGGVGRSTLTAAIARLAAKKNVRVLIAELGDDLDDYSPLAKLFGRERLPSQVEQLAPGIQGVLLFARTGQELFLKSVLRSGTLARVALSSESLRRLLLAGPSFREMGIFFQLLTYLRTPAPQGGPLYDLILVDMPATGHTLSLTGLPQLLLGLLPRGPIAEALKEGQGYLNDPKRAAAWLVAIPETLPVSECLELLAGLRTTGMPIGGVLLNRQPTDPFTPEEREALRPSIDTANPLGAEGYRRLELAARETARLRASTPVTIVPLPELPSEGLVDALGEALLVARPLPPQRSEP